jgi:hypothetical protein
MCICFDIIFLFFKNQLLPLTVWRLLTWIGTSRKTCTSKFITI